MENPSAQWLLFQQGVWREVCGLWRTFVGGAVCLLQSPPPHGGPAALGPWGPLALLPVVSRLCIITMLLL